MLVCGMDTVHCTSQKPDRAMRGEWQDEGAHPTHLTKIIKMDCITGGQMYRRLATTPENDTHPYSEGSLTDSPIKSSTSTPARSPKAASEHSALTTSPNPSLSSPNYHIRSARHKAWVYQSGTDNRYDINNDGH